MKILTLSLVSLLSIPATQFAMEPAEATPCAAEANRILDEALAKAREDQPQFQEQAPPTHPSARANLPTDESKTSTNHRPSFLHSHMPLEMRLAGDLPMKLLDFVSNIEEKHIPFKELTDTVKKADNSLNTVLAHYKALAKDEALQTPEALDTFKKEKEEFNEASNATYELLGGLLTSNSKLKLLMNHPATTRLSVKVALNMKSLAAEDNTKLALAQDVAALYKGLEFLQSRVKKSHSSSSGSSSDSE